MNEAYHTTEQAIPVGEEHKALCEQLLAYNAIAFELAAVKHFGAAAGIMARQMLFLNDKGETDDFWIYKSRTEWYEDIGLKRKAQEGARKRLIKAGVMIEEKRLHHGRWRLYFRLVPGKLMEIVGDDLRPAGSTRDEVPPSRDEGTMTGDERAGTRAGASPVLQKTTSELQKTTSETTSEEVCPLGPPRGADPEGKGKAGSGRGPADTSSLDAKREPAQNRAGEGRVKERSPRRRSRSRVGALQTPEAGLTALTEYRNRLGGATMKHYALVAKRWDFTKDNPPWWVMKELDNNYRTLDRVERVVREAVQPADNTSLPSTPKEKLIPYDYIPPVSPPDGSVTDTDGTSRPAFHLADQQTIQTVLEAVEIEDF